MKHFTALSLWLVLIATSSCGNSRHEKEIQLKTDQLYASQTNIYGKDPDPTLFDANIVAAIKKVQQITKEDEERIKKSDMPTDTPILLEGSVFTSLYDGYTSYKLKEVNVNGNSAKAVVEFVYNDTPKIVWNDTLIFINKNGWKISNIVFTTKYSNHKDLKERLHSVSPDTANR